MERQVSSTYKQDKIHQIKILKIHLNAMEEIKVLCTYSAYLPNICTKPTRVLFGTLNKDVATMKEMGKKAVLIVLLN